MTNLFKHSKSGWLHDGRQLDGYKLCVWLGDHNRITGTISPLILHLFVVQTPRPYAAHTYRD